MPARFAMLLLACSEGHEPSSFHCLLMNGKLNLAGMVDVLNSPFI